MQMKKKNVRNKRWEDEKIQIDTNRNEEKKKKRNKKRGA